MPTDATDSYIITVYTRMRARARETYIIGISATSVGKEVFMGVNNCFYWFKTGDFLRG